jgi:hypothetical protein
VAELRHADVELDAAVSGLKPNGKYRFGAKMKPTINISFWHALALLAFGMPLTVRGQDRIPIESAAKPLKIYTRPHETRLCIDECRISA